MKAFQMGGCKYHSVSAESLHVLRCSEERIIEINKTPEEFKKGHCYSVINGVYYNFYEQFLDRKENSATVATLCGTCYDSVTKGHIPVYSLSGGIDYGSPDSLHLEPLTIAEELCIAHGRPYMTIVKLTGSQPEERQSANRGHIYTVPQSDEALTAEIATMKMGIDQQLFPRVNDISRYIGIVFVGGRPQWDGIQINHYKQMPEIQVNADKIYRYLRALKALNPLYKGIVIDDSSEMTNNINNIPTLLLTHVKIIDGKMETKIESLLEQEHVPMNKSEMDSSLPPMQSAFLTRGRVMPTDVDSSGVHIFTSMEKAMQTNTSGEKTPVLLLAGTEPFNEFDNNRMLIYSTFTSQFFLGKGILKEGSLSNPAIRHMMMHYDNRFSKCARLVYLIFDQMKRHAAARTISARVKSNPASFDQFSEWVKDSNFIAKLKTAREHPERQESKELLYLLNKHISLFEDKIPFTAGARHSSMGDLYAMIYYLGFPSDFGTFSIDDVYGLHNIRLSIPTANNHEFPAVDGGLTHALQSNEKVFQEMKITPAAMRTLLASNPVAAAETFRLIVQALFTHVLGMPPSQNARKTVSLPERQHGISGTITGAFGCVETQDRGSLHMHFVTFGSLTPTVLQQAGGIPFMLPSVTRLLERKQSTSLSSVTHVRHLISDINDKVHPRATLFTSHNPITEPNEFLCDVERTVDNCNIHQHSRSCCKKNCISCRHGRPAATISATCCVQLKPAKKSSIHPNIYDVLKTIQPSKSSSQKERDFNAFPIQQLDDRILIWELKRPVIQGPYCACCPFNETEPKRFPEFDYLELPCDLKEEYERLSPENHKRIERSLCYRNGSVVEYNPILSAILGCNTNYSFLGSDSQSRSACCYVIKYITKNPSEITSILPLAYSARCAVQKYPSKAEDSGTVLRTAIHYTNAILNQITGLEEIAAEMAAAAILGMAAETVTPHFQLAFVTAAVAYSDSKYKEINRQPLTIEQEFAEHHYENKIIDDFTEESDEDPILQPTDDDHQQVYEPFENANNEEAESWGDNEGYCTSPIYTGLTGKIAVPQHLNYSGRGSHFLEYSLYCYTALVSVVPKIVKSLKPIESDTTNEPGTEKKSSAGRKSNGRFPFASFHPLAETHEQQLRSKPSIPKPIPIPPKPPGKRNKKLTEAWMQQARKFASYILILFRPWSDQNGRLPGKISWHAMCRFLNELRKGKNESGQTVLGRIRDFWIKMVARGMRMSAAPRTAASQYRKRKATIWTRPDGTANLGSRKRGEDIGTDMNDDDFNVDCNPTDDRNFDPDDPQTIIDMMRLAAGVADHIDGRKSREMAYHTATLSHLNSIMGNNDTINANKKPSITMEAIQQILFSETGSSHQPFETIIEALKTDPDVDVNSMETTVEPSKSLNVVNTHAVSSSVESEPHYLLNSEQLYILSLCSEYFTALKLHQTGFGPKPNPLRLFIHGGPGVGKTFVINAIKSAAENLGFTAAATAFTGTAVKSLPKGISRTMHTTFGFQIEQTKVKKDLDYEVGATDQQLVRLRSHFELKTLAVMIIDEISYISSEFFGRIEKRTREIMASPNEPFGGLAFIIVGDMFQFPPIDGSALYVSVCDLFLRNKKMSASERAGTQLFTTFRKVELIQQVRAAHDEKHISIINRIRQINPPMEEIIAEIQRDYQVLSKELIERDPIFLSCEIAVTTNNQRFYINQSQSKAFARRNNTCRFTWKENICGTHITHLKHQSSINSLYLNEPSLTCYFVANAPGIIRENINPTRGLTNGTTVTLHSLVLDDREDKACVADAMFNSTIDTDIVLRFPPKYINVRMDNVDVKEYGPFTLVPDEAVIPITSTRSASRHHNYTPESNEQIPFSSRSLNVDLRFAKTFQKLQSQTCKRIIADLNLRPFIPKVTYHGFLVTISRVTHHLHFCRMPDQPGSGGIAYLSTLHPPQDLATWLSSYDDEGLWEVAKLALPVVETTKIGTYRGTKRKSAKLPIDSSVPVLKRPRKNKKDPPGFTANDSLTDPTVNAIHDHQSVQSHGAPTIGTYRTKKKTDVKLNVATTVPIIKQQRKNKDQLAASTMNDFTTSNQHQTSIMESKRHPKV